MPRYIGEGFREMYWQRGGRWYHRMSGGKSFDSLEAARADYDAMHRVDFKLVLAALLILFFVILFMIAYLNKCG